MLEAKKVLDWIKLTGKQAFILVVMSSILLFSSNELITQLGLTKIKEITQPWVGGIWIISLAILVSEIAHPIYKFLSNKVKSWSNLKNGHARLNQLTPDEKVFLKYYIEQDTRTNSSKYSNGVVKELEAVGIVQDRSGKVISRFEVDIKASWQGNVGTLDETFFYPDKSTSKRLIFMCEDLVLLDMIRVVRSNHQLSSEVFFNSLYNFKVFTS